MPPNLYSPFSPQKMEIIQVSDLGRALDFFVNKDDKNAFQSCVKGTLENTQVGHRLLLFPSFFLDRIQGLVLDPSGVQALGGLEQLIEAAEVRVKADMSNLNHVSHIALSRDTQTTVLEAKQSSRRSTRTQANPICTCQEIRRSYHRLLT